MFSVTAAEPSTRFRSSTDDAPRANSVPRDVHCFAVAADPSPGLLPRVLELIAKRGLVPLRVHATLEGTPRNLNMAMHRVRKQWMKQMVRREERVIDVILTGHTVNSLAFFAEGMDWV